jgi:Ca-activated chloride channel family protein
MAEHALGFSLSPNLPNVVPGAGPQRVYFVAEVKTQASGVEPVSTPLSTIFLLDVSGSMSGPPLEHVVRSVEKLVHMVHETDRVGIVAFGDHGTEVSPLVPASTESKQLLCSRVRRLAANGQTNMEGGLRLAASMFPPRGLHERQILLLLSDGQPNVGASTPDALGPVVAAMRPHVSVSALGYGIKHDDSVLGAIAAAGAGRYHFVPDPQTCQHEFALALGAQGDVVAEGLVLTLSPGEGVEILGLAGGLKARFGPGGLVVPLADMLDGEVRIVVAEALVRIDGERRPADVLRGRLTYRRAGRQGDSVLEETARVSVGSVPGEPFPEVQARVLLVRCDDVRQQARVQADRGQWEGAAALLRAFLAEVRAAPGFVAGSGSPLAEAYELLLDEAIAMERRPTKEVYETFRKSTLGMSSVALASRPPSMSPRSMAMSRASAGDFPRAVLVAVGGPFAGQHFLLGARNTIGRTPAASVVLAHERVSRMHAEVFAQDGRFWLADLGSTNATLLNGERLELERIPLSHGDVIAIGGFELRFEEQKMWS